ncbi:hypothetical protein GQ44DRAFT_703982 [Phaeosphaeriaceae sp. PMI808]|nr:hypothetical protein GQ44DRAFT_717454 [Phaeosphaeriaceae sp. PMI808]KAH8708432.1 hypothetical protein GQ44DRAFT_715517 [Phaeosphaeriaceae sp. PMI808]KAH8710228.1 hypothetical protein GQ44DRAFT_714336 [Phaeosphaeriaceae sp. PMI808]KAH8727336.1 hypothetical protein GQ44DRAFT_703982 [Phaeosphaeriaceae sp. PMI808]
MSPLLLQLLRQIAACTVFSLSLDLRGVKTICMLGLRGHLYSIGFELTEFGVFGNVGIQYACRLPAALLRAFGVQLSSIRCVGTHNNY